MASSPIVTVDFVLNGVHSGTIAISDPNVGAVNVVSSSARESNTSFEYSGRHDHGELPPLKKEGVNASLVAALQDAKRECDRILTEKINLEYGYDNSETKMDLDAEMEEEPEKKAKKLRVEKKVDCP